MQGRGTAPYGCVLNGRAARYSHTSSLYNISSMFGIYNLNALHPFLTPLKCAEGNGHGLFTHGPLDLIEHDSLYKFSKFGGRSSHAVHVMIFFCGA